MCRPSVGLAAKNELLRAATHARGGGRNIRHDPSYLDNSARSLPWRPPPVAQGQIYISLMLSASSMLIITGWIISSSVNHRVLAVLKLAP